MKRNNSIICPICDREISRYFVSEPYFINYVCPKCKGFQIHYSLISSSNDYFSVSKKYIREFLKNRENFPGLTRQIKIAPDNYQEDDNVIRIIDIINLVKTRKILK